MQDATGTLCLTVKKKTQSILIGEDILITVVKIDRGRVTLQIRSPKSTSIERVIVDGLAPLSFRFVREKVQDI